MGAEQRREITLIRHGKPLTERGWHTAAEFSSWLLVEGERGIRQGDVPVHGGLPQDCLVYCSNLRRAIESTALLAGAGRFHVDPIFREAGLGPLRGPTWLRLPMAAWTVIARVRWLLHLSDGPESPDEARRRAALAAAKLDTDADKHARILVLGHGFFHALVATELRRLGWRGPKRPRSRHWERTTYVKG